MMDQHTIRTCKKIDGYRLCYERCFLVQIGLGAVARLGENKQNLELCVREKSKINKTKEQKVRVIASLFVDE